MSKRWAALLVGLAALTAASWAGAAGPNGLAERLNKNPVYVEAGAPQTTADTAGELLGQLKPEDGIVIAIVKEGDAAQLARGINASLQRRIIAVAVGDTVVGYSTILPAGTAADLMRRAATVSTTTPETIGTYIQNVHDWQAAHPKAAAAKPVKEKKDGHGVFVVALLASFAALVIAGSLLVRAATKDEEVKLRKSPEAVKDPLRRLLESKEKINDASLQQTLVQAARDVEAYFQRNKDTQESERLAFAKHLTSLNKVMEKYIDVQDNPRYFEDPQTLLANGKAAAEAFAYFVLGTVQRSESRSLTDFRVDTDILSAQRYR